MPIKQNAKKALRQAKKRTEANKKVKEASKKAVKAVLKVVATGVGDIKEVMRLAQQKLDKAAKKGIIKKRTASRKLSRLMKKIVKK